MKMSKVKSWIFALLGIALIALPQPVFSLSTPIALPLAVVAIFLLAAAFSYFRDGLLDSRRESQKGSKDSPLLLQLFL